ncbi:MAG: ATP-grasp domain-containing protein [Nitrospirota bacterium]|nr:ATP-grasp domain-containing protein [Nitrospirota bacterium]
MAADKSRPVILVLHNDAVTPLHSSTDDAVACNENSDVAEDVAQTLSETGFATTLVTAETFFEMKPKDRPPFDVVFNLCEGFRGDSHREGAVAGWMEMMGWRFTGNLAWTLALCQDKALTKTLLMQSGVPTPRFAVIAPGTTDELLPADAVIVKPLREDASQGVTDRSIINLKTDGTSRLEEQIAYIHKTYRQPALVEEYIEGRELNVAILNGDILPISEIDFSGLPEDKPHICTYDAKWQPKSPDYLLTPAHCPARLDRSVEQRVKEMALRSWQAMRCRSYARIDIRLAADGSLYVLEVNPNPSLHREAGFARSCNAAGIPFDGMLECIVSCTGIPC